MRSTSTLLPVIMSVILFSFGCTDDRESLEEPIQPETTGEQEPAPSEEPLAEEPMPENSYHEEIQSDGDMGDAEDAELQEGGSAAPSPVAPMQEDDSVSDQPATGKGGIISSGVRERQKKCKSIKNPQQKQQCLDKAAANKK